MTDFIRIVAIRTNALPARQAQRAPREEHLGLLGRVLSAEALGGMPSVPAAFRALPSFCRYNVLTERGDVLEVFSDEVNPVSTAWLATQELPLGAHAAA